MPDDHDVVSSGHPTQKELDDYSRDFKLIYSTSSDTSFGDLLHRLKLAEAERKAPSQRGSPPAG